MLTYFIAVVVPLNTDAGSAKKKPFPSDFQWLVKVCSGQFICRLFLAGAVILDFDRELIIFIAQGMPSEEWRS